jgi:hypothetical protein
LAKAYRGKSVESLLDFASKKALNNKGFIYKKGSKIFLSNIFIWYKNDFGKTDQELIKFINQFREKPFKSSNTLSYYDYDWTLNGVNVNSLSKSSSGNSSGRYVVSAAIPKGSVEIKVFNNLYTQVIEKKRSTFFTSSISTLYGIKHGFNVGIIGRYRFVRNDATPSSPFEVFTFEKSMMNRTGLTAIGPQIRFVPFKSMKNITAQSSLTFPLGKILAGNEEKPYIDWNGAVFNTQFFNDMTLSNSFSLFTEIDLLIEDIGLKPVNYSYRTSTPLTIIFSYFPFPKTTLYTLVGFSPYWQKEFDYFYQAGIGTKYQLSSQFEVELFYSGFRNRFILTNEGKAATYNLGFRYSK